MRTSKTKPLVVSAGGNQVIFCIPQPRMTLGQYAQMTGQKEAAVRQQADAGKFILAKGKYGKYREINMVAEFLKEYEAAQKALRETA
ncbi:hypothetical protein EL06_23610 [Salmonella enterica subsp. diarizonae]|uniref:Uncharacterized protein n=1 Tax=Salmonella diarizonae TaxID=59204 RepID=A0A6C8Y1K9_SALDZ|nr:hypothetical protein [Salmonella enterica subsp. diarizonae]